MGSIYSNNDLIQMKHIDFMLNMLIKCMDSNRNKLRHCDVINVRSVAHSLSLTCWGGGNHWGVPTLIMFCQQLSCRQCIKLQILIQIEG